MPCIRSRRTFDPLILLRLQLFKDLESVIEELGAWGDLHRGTAIQYEIMRRVRTVVTHFKRVCGRSLLPLLLLLLVALLVGRVQR